MNYKDIVKSRDLRVAILTFLGWIPDSIMLRLQYWLQTGRMPDLKNPKRYTEKLQVYKMKYRNASMLRCTDKFEVRKYIDEKGFGKYLIPIIGIYDKVDDIDFNTLPEKFVAKTTDGGGGNQVLICKDKKTLDPQSFYTRLHSWMNARKVKKHAGREWAYENNYPRRILIEVLLEADNLCDYKFFCFNGKVAYIYGISDREVGQIAKFGIYDKDFNKLDVIRNGEYPQETPLPKPQNFDEMMSLAEELSKDFPHVRVDLYNIEGRIYFGELTFYNGSGYSTFTPDSFDEQMGHEFDVCSML